jgi:predicted nucleic acid-binding protein
MQDKVFLDSNIIIYTYSNSELEKQKQSRLIFEQYDNVNISNQVINEVTNILFKKFKLESTQVETTVLQINDITTIFNFTLETQIKAIRLKKDYNLQFYDALIIATALENNCNILYSEDMQDSIVIDNKLKIINPFKEIN